MYAAATLPFYCFIVLKDLVDLVIMAIQASFAALSTLVLEFKLVTKYKRF